MLLEKQGDWISARVGDEIVMMSAEQGKYVGLNDVGARIWELIDEPRSVESLCAQLVEEFDVTDETCRAEVADFVDKLRDYHAIRLAA